MKLKNMLRKNFNIHFNLGFGVPSSDTCGTCNAINIKIQEAKSTEDKHRLKEEKESHLCKSQQFYSEIHTCTEMAPTWLVYLLILNKISHCHIYLLMKSFTCVNFGFMSSAFMILLLERVIVFRDLNEVASVLFHYLKS